MEHFTEDPSLVLWVLGFCAACVIVGLIVTRRGVLLFVFAGILGLAALALLIDALVLTDREHIDGIIIELAQAAEAENSAELIRHLDDPCNFRGAALSHEGMQLLADRIFKQFRIDRVSVGNRKTSVTGDEGICDFHTTVRGGQAASDGPPYIARWKLFFERKQKAWKVVKIEQHRALTKDDSPPGIPGLP